MKYLTERSKISVRQAMKKLNKTGGETLVITDEKNFLLGTLSDGDVRRAILKGVSMSDSIESIYQNNPTVLLEGKYKKSEAKKLFLKYNYDLIPIVDEKGMFVDILFSESIFLKGSNRKKKKLDVPVVIMAGGKGTRMEPFTKIFPKPLLPFNEKTVIEHVIERFKEIGCNEFHLTVNFKARILKAYFEELKPDCKINFIDEKIPLGTAGSLYFLGSNFDQPFFVTNCDIIIKTDYVNLYEFHQKNNYDITLVASTKEYIIPYGTCQINNEGHLSRINEKPHYDFLVNTGLYVISPGVLKLIPKNKFYHITNLIEEAKKCGKKIGIFPIDDDAWIDVGQWTEYQKAVEKF